MQIRKAKVSKSAWRDRFTNVVTNVEYIDSDCSRRRKLIEKSRMQVWLTYQIQRLRARKTLKS